MDITMDDGDRLKRQAGEVPSADEIRQWLNRRAKTVLEENGYSEEVDNDMALNELGVDSLVLFTITGELAEWLERDIPATLLFEVETINEVVTELSNLIGVAEGKVSVEKSEAQISSTFEKSTTFLSPDVHEKMCAMTRNWQGKRVTADSLLFGLNTTGSKQPLYWCCQGFHELERLASRLGPDQPVYGMRSGYLVMEPTKEALVRLARHYVRETRTVQPNGPYLLGGNCQSGIIAWEMAKGLLEQNENITLLAILDVLIPRPYAGKIAYFFGRDSGHNPYCKFHEPMLGLHTLYPRGFSFDEIPGRHGEFFLCDENIAAFGELLQQRIEEAKVGQISGPQNVIPSQYILDDVYQCHVSAPAKLKAIAGASTSIPVTVRNTSSAPWSVTERSGFMLGCHWLDRKARMVKWLDGVVPLLNPLLPDEEAELVLPVTMPEKRGRYTLQLDMVQQGVTWFSEKGAPASLVDVRVSSEGIVSRQIADALFWRHERAA